MRSTRAAVRSRVKARRGPRAAPAARTVPGAARRRVALSAAGLRPRRRSLAWRRVVAEPGGPAEAERAGDQDLVAADGDVGADLEVGPAQLILDLFVALLGPVPDPVGPHDLLKARGGCGLPASRGLPGRGRLVARDQVALSGRMPGLAVATTRRANPSPPRSAPRPFSRRGDHTQGEKGLTAYPGFDFRRYAAASTQARRMR